jgi:hypothetical protein
VVRLVYKADVSSLDFEGSIESSNGWLSTLVFSSINITRALEQCCCDLKECKLELTCVMCMITRMVCDVVDGDLLV